MELNYLEKIPEAKNKKENKELITTLNEFKKSGKKAAELKFDKKHYKNAASFYSTVRSNVVRHNIPAKVFIRQGKLYLGRI